MNTTVITLAQAAANIEENGQSIKVGSFDTFGAFASYFDIHYRPMLERIQNGDEISDKDRHLLNFLASDLLEAMGADGSEDGDEGEDSPVIEPQEITEQREQNDACISSAESRRDKANGQITDPDEDPTLTEAEKRDTLCRLWDAAWHQAKADQKTYRVIVETNEGDPSAPGNEFGRYYMIDFWSEEDTGEGVGRWVVIRSDIAESPYEVHRPNWHTAEGYSDHATQPHCRVSNRNNLVRWALRMIDAGRVTDIYADCY